MRLALQPASGPSTARLWLWRRITATMISTLSEQKKAIPRLYPHAIEPPRVFSERLANPCSFAAPFLRINSFAREILYDRDDDMSLDDTNSMGGLEKQARSLSRALWSSGHDVVVLASTRQLFRTGWTYDDGIPVRYFWTYTTPQVSGRHLPAALIWAIQLLIWIFLNRSKISVLHCHQIRIHAFVASISSKLWKIPSILKSAVGGTGADTQHWFSKIFRFCRASIYNPQYRHLYCHNSNYQK